MIQNHKKDIISSSFSSRSGHASHLAKATGAQHPLYLKVLQAHLRGRLQCRIQGILGGGIHTTCPLAAGGIQELGVGEDQIFQPLFDHTPLHGEHHGLGQGVHDLSGILELANS